MIREYRTDAGMSITDLSEKVECSRTHLSLVERGKRRPSVSLCTRVCDVLEIDRDRLLCAAGHTPPDVIDLILQQPSLAQEVRRLAAAK